MPPDPSATPPPDPAPGDPAAPAPDPAAPAPAAASPGDPAALPPRAMPPLAPDSGAPAPIAAAPPDPAIVPDPIAAPPAGYGSLLPGVAPGGSPWAVDPDTAYDPGFDGYGALIHATSPYGPPPAPVAPPPAPAYAGAGAAFAPARAPAGRGVRLPAVFAGRPWLIVVAAFALGGLLFSAATCALVFAVVPSGTTGPAAPPTAVPFSASSAVARATALAAQGVSVYGPEDGTLDMAGDNTVATENIGADLGDFIADAVFTNPDVPSSYGWDYGFIFRDAGVDYDIRCYVTSDGDWAIKQINEPAVASPNPGGLLPDNAIITLDSGQVRGLHRDTGATNRMQLVVQGSSAVLFVNATYIATVTLPADPPRGDVDIATAFRADDNPADTSTAYSGFQVWSLDP